FWTNLLLAGRCLATRPTIWQTTLREEVTTRLLHTLTNTAYSLTQGLIADVLAEIGGREVNVNLVRLLADEKLGSDVRVYIALALGNLSERAVAPDLVRLLADEKLDSNVRVYIALALGNLGERAVAPDLVRLLADEKLDNYVRVYIAVALGNLGERA